MEKCVIECRLVTEIGRRWLFGQSWHSEDKEYHVQEYPITKEQFDEHSFEARKIIFGIPTKCSACNVEYKGEEIKYHASERRVWDTKDGNNNHPGDMFYAPWMHRDEDGHCMYWDSCKDPRGHLMVQMPDGGTWDIDSRASNCTMKEDRNHRCWIKHGEAPNITVDKNGNTCAAGAGSIQMINWHGFLREGKLVQ